MTSSPLTEDRAHLRRALELAEGGRGRVSPNPLVGAVIVRDGESIGEGFHAALGELHAEVAALADCRGAATTRPGRRCTSRSSPARTRAASRRAPTRSSPPASPAW